MQQDDSSRRNYLFNQLANSRRLENKHLCVVCLQDGSQLYNYNQHVIPESIQGFGRTHKKEIYEPPLFLDSADILHTS